MKIINKNRRAWIAMGRRIMLGAGCCAVAFSADLSVQPSSLPKIGQVDTRFQAYNVEMLEVTGGKFWKPYKDLRSASEKTAATGKSGATPAGMNPNLYEYRPPINLTNARLRKLAKALGPAYIRVSGTWANTTYFQDANGPAPSTPPKGFNGVLTREQWKGVVDFAHAVNAEIVTSFAISAGTRNAQGVWTPEQARAFLAYTKSVGGKIAAAEFMNEPNIAMIGGAPRGYNAADYARDIAVFRPFLKKNSPDTLFLGPGSVAETSTTAAAPGNIRMIPSADLLKATGPVFDVFDYHLYAAVSERCASMGAGMGTTAAAALSDEWLERAGEINAFYTSLRDRYDPGKPIWVTETADAACGGNPWASTFLDTFRYLDEHARLAEHGVQVVTHNTLDASDYGLLDENTYAPRPDYWAALLWHNLMGSTVLKGTSAPRLHVYAHCLAKGRGGVAVLAINNDKTAAKTIDVGAASDRYTLTAPKLEATRVELNGKGLRLGAGDSMPELKGVRTPGGAVTLPPASITFLAIRGAHNAGCQ